MKSPLPSGALAALVLALSPLPAAAQTFTPIDPPCPLTSPSCPGPGGLFGYAVAVCDFNGDGQSDLAVGEPGQDAVYVFYGPNFTTWDGFTPSGGFSAPSCPTPVGEGFGKALYAYDYDPAFPGDELLVGAPDALPSGAVYIVRDASAPASVSSTRPGVAKLGTTVVCGDFGGGPELEIACGAPNTTVQGVSCGTVHLFREAPFFESVIVNPGLAAGDAINGAFGSELDAGFVDGDGIHDLLVGAQGNELGALANVGAVYYFQGPVFAPAGIATPAPVRINDVNIQACENGTRFAKSICYRAGRLVVGAPRKEELGGCPVTDVGGGFVYDGPTFAAGQQLPTVNPVMDGLYGFNVTQVDLIGNSVPDVLVVGLDQHEVSVFNGANLSAPPAVIPMPVDVVYWALGIDHGQLVTGNAKEEVVFGDPRFNSCAGRVRILER